MKGNKSGYPGQSVTASGSLTQTELRQFKLRFYIEILVPGEARHSIRLPDSDRAETTPETTV